MNKYWYSKARHALIDGLKNINIKSGDKILIPSYICNVIPDILTHHKYKIFYYDIDENFSPNFELIKNICKSNDIKAILIIQYFGIIIDIEKIKLILLNKCIKIIEDRTHILPDNHCINTKNLYSDLIIYSPRKIFGKKNGGLLLINKKIVVQNINVNNYKFIYKFIYNFFYLLYIYLGLKLIKRKFNFTISKIICTNIYRFKKEKSYFEIEYLIKEKNDYLNLKIWNDLIVNRLNNKEEWIRYLSKYDFYIPKKFINGTCVPWAIPLFTNDLEKKNKLIKLCLQNNINIFAWPNLPNNSICRNNNNLLMRQNLLLIELNLSPPFTNL